MNIDLDALGVNTDNLLFASLYGSRKENSDVDIFLVFNGVKPEKSVVVGEYDLNQIEYGDFLFRLSNLDPEYTDPLLTGEQFFGNYEVVENISEFLRRVNLSEGSFDYLSKRGLETFLQAEMLFSGSKYDLFKENVNTYNFEDVFENSLGNVTNAPPKMLKSLSSLTYAFSYLAFRERYSNGFKLLTLKEILESPITEFENNFGSFMNYYKKVAPANIEINIVGGYFDYIEEKLRNGKFY